MINGYSALEEQYTKSITYIVIYANGAISYEDAWMLSDKQLKELDHIISEKTKAMGGGVL